MFWDHFHDQCGHFRCIFKSSGSSSATCASLDMEKHIVSINRKKGSELISLNSLLPCLHMSLEDSVLIWLLKQARTQLESLCVCVCLCVFLLVCSRLTLMGLNIQIDICCGSKLHLAVSHYISVLNETRDRKHFCCAHNFISSGM